MGGKRLSQEQIEHNIKNICQSKNYTFSGWREQFKSKKSRIILQCVEHGEWDTKCYHFLNGSGCPICGGTRINQEIRTKQLKEKCKNSTSEFVSFKEGFKNGDSICEMICSIHGGWFTTVNRIIFACVHCPLCVSNRQKTKEERESEINKICKEKNYIFKGWLTEKITWESKIILQCEDHGDFILTVNKLTSRLTECPSCSKSGFNPSKHSTLYLLRSTSGEHLKIGISNQYKQRIAGLKAKTPFPFDIIELYHSDGNTIQSLEKDFHKHFESAGLTGFDGCTEWLKWNPNITTLFRIL